MRQFTENWSQGYFNTLRRYGGTTTGMQASFGFDMDPQGTADNRFSARLRDSQGNVIYEHTQSGGRDDEDMQRAIKQEVSRSLLAALQNSDLPHDLANIFNSISATTATEEQIASLFALADAFNWSITVSSETGNTPSYGTVTYLSILST